MEDVSFKSFPTAVAVTEEAEPEEPVTPEAPDDQDKDTEESDGSTGHGGINYGSTHSESTYYADGRYDASTAAEGTWIRDSIGWWYSLPDGSYPRDGWYECYWEGELKWYHFNEEGYADGGWYEDKDGHTYYLHPYHDGDYGYMYRGWKEIGGRNYFFSIGVPDMPEGALLRGRTTPDGHKVGDDGAWVPES